MIIVHKIYWRIFILAIPISTAKSLYFCYIYQVFCSVVLCRGVCQPPEVNTGLRPRGHTVRNRIPESIIVPCAYACAVRAYARIRDTARGRCNKVSYILLYRQFNLGDSHKPHFEK